jgi:hypothetical protein
MLFDHDAMNQASEMEFLFQLKRRVFSSGPYRDTRAGGHLGGKDYVRAAVVLGLQEQSHQSDGLDGLAQAHLIRKDAIDAIVVERQEELYSAKLVRAQSAVLKHFWLFHLAEMDQ